MLLNYPRMRGAPPELARMLRHLRRWEQALPDEPPDSVDRAPFDSVTSLPRWRADVTALAAIPDKLELFDRFGNLEDELEPLETGPQEVIDAVEAAGELAAGIARGA
jgi:hypothetical protein